MFTLPFLIFKHQAFETKGSLPIRPNASANTSPNASANPPGNPSAVLISQPITHPVSGGYFINQTLCAADTLN